MRALGGFPPDQISPFLDVIFQSPGSLGLTPVSSVIVPYSREIAFL
jgi:hypothetical protein